MKTKLISIIIASLVLFALAASYLFSNELLKSRLHNFEDKPRILSEWEARLLHAAYLVKRPSKSASDDIADQLTMALLYAGNATNLDFTLWKISAAVSVVDKNIKTYPDDRNNYIFATFQKLVILNRLSEIKQIPIDRDDLKRLIQTLNNAIAVRHIDDDFQLAGFSAQVGLAESLLLSNPSAMDLAFRSQQSIVDATKIENARAGAKYFALYEGIAYCNQNREIGLTKLSDWLESANRNPAYMKTLFMTWDFGLAPVLTRFKNTHAHICSEISGRVLAFLETYSYRRLSANLAQH